MADYDSVASTFSSTKKLVADHETIASVEESVSREKRNRELNVVQTVKDRQHLHNFLERKAELCFRLSCAMLVACVPRFLLVVCASFLGGTGLDISWCP